VTLPYLPEGANDYDEWKMATPPEYNDGTGHESSYGCRLCGSTTGDGEPKRPPAPMMPGTERVRCECGAIYRRSRS
jgi:hypothetical protein